MRKKDIVSVWVLMIIVSIFTVSVFAVPTINNLKESMKLSKYDSNTENIIDSAKSKYSANINDIKSDGIVEYTVEELIKEGYFKENDINPITGEKYNKDDKVLVITKNGYVSYKYISGTTIINKIRESEETKEISGENYYIGENPNNYVSFNEEIYRIIKIDKDSNIVIANEDFDKKVSKNKINSYLDISFNDRFNEDYKKMILSDLEIIDYESYKNTFDNGKSYLNKNYDYDIWVKYANEYKSYNNVDNNFNDNVDEAWIKEVIKIDCSLIVEKGNGTRTNPYILSK